MDDQDRWQFAADKLLKNEGGKTVDHAGPTNMGVTLRFLIGESTDDTDNDGFLDGDYDQDGDVDQDDLNVMTAKQALDLYKRTFWDRYKTNTIHTDKYVCAKVFDLAVNCGPRQAHKLLQRAARAAHIDNANLIDDGLIGPQSLTAIGRADGAVLLAALRCEAAGFYRLLVSKKPDLKIFIKGWLRRAYEL